MSRQTDDVGYMQLALKQAHSAAASGEVPVGAVVVQDGRVIAVGHNAPVGTHDPTAHAEIVALREAARVLGNYRLTGCELFVTLEPCAMCCGAMLHARIARLVFGADDPKAGAAGSVLNLFAEPALNHQTRVQGGVLAAECSAMLRSFFAARRAHQVQGRLANHPLRPDALRTADAHFEALAGYPWQPRYLSDLPALGGLRMHYLDEGPQDAPLTFMCLHGIPTWSYLYRKMIPIFLEQGHRVLAPDLIGFGKSDKPKKSSAHRFSWHRQVLLEWVDRLNPARVVLLVHGWGGWLGMGLPPQEPRRYVGLLAMNTCMDLESRPISQGTDAGYRAPFPDPGYRAAIRASTAFGPNPSHTNEAAIAQHTLHFWQNDGDQRTLMAWGMQDLLLAADAKTTLHAALRNCPEPVQMTDAGHLSPEFGEPIARLALSYFSQPAPAQPKAGF